MPDVSQACETAPGQERAKIPPVSPRNSLQIRHLAPIDCGTLNPVVGFLNRRTFPYRRIDTGRWRVGGFGVYRSVYLGGRTGRAGRGSTGLVSGRLSRPSLSAASRIGRATYLFPRLVRLAPSWAVLRGV